MKDWMEQIAIEGIIIPCKIDSGANVVSIRILESIDSSIEITSINMSLKAYGGMKIPTLGKISLKCVLNNIEIEVEFIIVEMDVMTLNIGLSTSYQLQLVTPPAGMTDKRQNNFYNIYANAALRVNVLRQSNKGPQDCWNDKRVHIQNMIVTYVLYTLEHYADHQVRHTKTLPTNSILAKEE